MPGMGRREFITLLGGAAAVWPRAARAQQRFKIGLLDTGLGAIFAVPFMGKLAELGYAEGRNVVIERRSAEGNPERLKELAEDLVRQQVDVIVTAGAPAGFAAKKAIHQRSGRCRPGREPRPARRKCNRQLADGA